MCKHGTYAIMNLEVEVDKCMVPLIKTLQKYGIKTTSCCCGHGEEYNGEKINNRLVLSATGVSLGFRNTDGTAFGWKPASDFDIWGISFSIEKDK